MKKKDVELIKAYLNEQGVSLDSDNFQPKHKSTCRQTAKEIIELNDHPLIKVDVVDVDLDSARSVPCSFLAVHNDEVHLIRKVAADEYVAHGGGDLPPLASCDCFAARVSYRRVEPIPLARMLIKRTPLASLLLLVLVAFVMVTPVYSNLFNSRLVFGESVSSLLVVSLIFVGIFIIEYVLKNWIMEGLNREIEAETKTAEDVFFNKVINSKHKDAIVHWKTSTESIVTIWRSAGHIGLDALTTFAIMVMFCFMLGIYAVFPIVVYVIFFVSQLWFKMRAYRKILMLNQLKDQKLTYLIGMERGKGFFKFLNRDRIRRRWMSMTDDVAVFNVQIQDHEEKSSGVLKLYSSTSIVIIFISAYFAIQLGHMEQSAVIALMLLNGRCSGAISALSTRLYQSIIANSKLEGSVQALHEDGDSVMFEHGVVYTEADKKTLTAIGLSVTYDEHPVFSGIDLSVSQGMSMAVIGSIGSGKSSLLKVLSGYMRQSGGTVLFNDVAPSEYDPSFFKDHAAYYSPEDRFIDDTLAFNASLKYGGNLKEFVEQLRYFGAGFVLSQHAMYGASVDELRLSSGQYQMVKMVCSLGRNPSLIVMDEPCSHMSPAETLAFMQRLRSAFPDAIIIYSSHSVMLTKAADIILDINRKTVTTNKTKLQN